MNPKCAYCKGLGWVCENHPHMAWSDELGCQCGAGMPCECNQVDRPDELGDWRGADNALKNQTRRGPSIVHK
jgi:hypothetical protein